MSNKKGSSRKYQSIGDITIYEHANADITASRLKKGQIIIRETSFDQVSDIIEDNDELTQTKNRRKSKKIKENSNQMYNDYHIDIWFLISEHIDPEDVGTFARICSKTAKITSTAKFWFFIYKKYYNPEVSLPVRFQPGCMIRLGGLRACVIRSFFYTYPPLSKRIPTLSEQSYLCLIRKECIGIWNKQNINWSFCYKFKQKFTQGTRFYLSERKLKQKKIESYSDIYMNPEEGCQILVITTPSFRPIPTFDGQRIYLNSIVQSLSQGFRNNKLRLEFSDGTRNTLGFVVYDPITNIKVLDWWDPNYYEYL